MQDIELTIKEEFLSEAEEMLENCEQAFLDLERNPEDSSIIDSIFRFVHTIKGSGYAAGFEGLGNFVHDFEAVLSRVRSNELEMSNELMDLFLRATDKTTQFVQALRSDFSATIDTVEVTDSLRTFLPDSQSDGAPSIADGPGFVIFDDDDDDVPVGEAVVEAVIPAAERSEKVLEISTKPKQAAKETKWATACGRKPRIVICDDEEDILELLELAVSDLDLEVIKVKNGKEALEIIDSEQVDVILTDLKMPELDGLSLIEILQQNDCRAPVIFCSGFADRAELIKFIDGGAFGFIEKPFSNHQVSGRVARALELKLLQDAVQQLSLHNFRAYLAVTQMAKYAESGNSEKLTKAKAKVETELDEISRLTNMVLRPKAAKHKKSA